MSQELLTAFIGAVSTIFAALIGAFGAIAAAEKKRNLAMLGAGLAADWLVWLPHLWGQ